MNKQEFLICDAAENVDKLENTLTLEDGERAYDSLIRLRSNGSGAIPKMLWEKYSNAIEIIIERSLDF